MFIIEKPKEIHLNSWKEIINESASSNSFQFEEVNFSLFWTCIFRDDYFAFAAKNEDKFMGIVVAKINETYYEKNVVLDVLYVLQDFTHAIYDLADMFTTVSYAFDYLFMRIW